MANRSFVSAKRASEDVGCASEDVEQFQLLSNQTDGREHYLCQKTDKRREERENRNERKRGRKEGGNLTLLRFLLN